jgi:two-component system chemotaxis response regulator CheB
MHDETERFEGQRTRYANKKKVVIVDDSRSIRGWLRVVLEQDPRLEVVGEADCAETARQVIKQTKPDVITLDNEMPGMNGLVFLEKLMMLHPMPVVMISGTTQSSSEATITALTLGAVDCILKPLNASDQSAWRVITRRVFSAACSTVQVSARQPITSSTRASLLPADKMPLILIGASTGGVAALGQVLGDLHSDGPPVVIVQHMPGEFLVSFSQLLNRNLRQDVAIARVNEPLNAGQIRLAPSLGQHTIISKHANEWVCNLVPNDNNLIHCPSVDMLFGTARHFGPDVIGVILTGLGKDGADGLLQLRESGAQTIGQDAQSSVVFGMPRKAWQIGAVDQQLPLKQIGSAINSAVATHARTNAGRHR